ncbi:MAG: C1 family peptidase [Labilithrix sp.]|nr:C1 family peptidase [Labilithrix sp.]
MHAALRFGSLALLVVGGCVARSGPAAPPPQAQAPIPPPAAYSQPAHVYYNGAAQPPPTQVPPMPPALSVRDWVNVQYLQTAAAQPRRCDHPIEVSPGNFIHLDCVPYRRVAISTAHMTPAKLLSIRSGVFKWNPLAALGVQVPGAAPSQVVGDSALPDMVDHRLNGTEGPVKDQGSVGSCTAFALSSTFDNSLRRATKNITSSPHHMWSRYAIPTMEDAASSNMNRNVTTHEILPYSGREACMMMKDSTDECGPVYNVRPNTASSDPALMAKVQRADASGGHKITAFEELQVRPPNIEEILAVLASGADLWTAFHIDSTAFTNRRMQNFVVPDWVIPDGGHAMTMSGYRKVNGRYQFLLHNSWGVSWGDQGYAWVSQAMVERFLHLAYKIKTDADPGGNTPSLPRTDEDCRADQVIDAVTKVCATVCADGSRPSNGQCAKGEPNGLPGWPQIPGLPTIPGWPPQPGPQPGPNPPNQPNPPTQPAWPWPMPPNLPTFFQPAPK